jgi:hypothetical protein
MGFGARHRGGGALISLGARIGGGAFQVALDGTPDGAVVVVTTLGASVGEDESSAVGDTEGDAVDTEIVGVPAGSSVGTSATATSPTAKKKVRSKLVWELCIRRLIFGFDRRVVDRRNTRASYPMGCRRAAETLRCCQAKLRCC